MFLTFAYHLISVDVLIDCIRRSGCGWCPVQLHSGSACFAQRAPLQSYLDLDDTF